MIDKRKYSLALDYHENSKSISVLMPFDPKTQYKIYPNSKTIQLQRNIRNEAKERDSFLKTLFSRKSTRSFTEQNINLATISSLLTLSCGQTNDNADALRRTYPSAGARYPIEVYVAVLRSSDIDKGIYHYNVKDDTLELIKPESSLDIISDFYKNQKNVILTDYPCLILFSIVFKRSMQKYGERGYRFALIDAGHMGQNLYLVAEYLNLGIVALGAGDDNDDILNDALGFIHTEESAFYSFAIGTPLTV